MIRNSEAGHAYEDLALKSPNADLSRLIGAMYDSLNLKYDINSTISSCLKFIVCMSSSQNIASVYRSFF